MDLIRARCTYRYILLALFLPTQMGPGHGTDLPSSPSVQIHAFLYALAFTTVRLKLESAWK